MERQQQPLPPLRRTSRWMLSESGCIDRSGIGPVPDNWSHFNIPRLAHEASFVFTRGGLGLEFILIGPQTSNQPTLKSKYRVACGETPIILTHYCVTSHHGLWGAIWQLYRRKWWSKILNNADLQRVYLLTRALVSSWIRLNTDASFSNVVLRLRPVQSLMRRASVNYLGNKKKKRRM